MAEGSLERLADTEPYPSAETVKFWTRTNGDMGGDLLVTVGGPDLCPILAPTARGAVRSDAMEPASCGRGLHRSVGHRHAARTSWASGHGA